MLVLIKIIWIILKIIFFSSILRSIIEFYYLKKFNFFITYNDGKFKAWRRKHKDVRNLFRLKKKQSSTTIKDIRNIFRLKKEIKEIKDIVLRNIKNIC